MRLRPSGEAGPIASHFAGFARYQRDSAWTWEHMALTRARPVAGDTALCQEISQMLQALLSAPRDPRKLVQDVAAMRRRMVEENPRPSPWDLKNRRGGLIDVEFIAQYLMLRHAAGSPEILYRSTVEALTALGAAGVLPVEAERELREAVKLLRNAQAAQTLFSDGAQKTATLAEADAATLACCVGAVDFVELGADITRATERVHNWYDRLVATPACHATEARGDSTQ